MRVFLCAFMDFGVAIPMRSVSSLALYADGAPHIMFTNMNGAAGYHQEEQNTYVSLPRLFNLQMHNIRHGIILKNSIGEAHYADDDAAQKRIILLSTAVECEAEFSDETMYPIPMMLSGTPLATVFSGMQCMNGASGVNGTILLLNTDRLIHTIRREMELVREPRVTEVVS